ncbi:MAG: type II toxin-antitoxin system prevent-host-death family antitoxin [Gemmatimonadales bacterium]
MTEPRDRSVKVAELKARLSAYLKHVRRGKSVVVCDRDTPIARLVPYDVAPAALPSRPARGRLADVRLPAPLGRDLGSAAALAEERQGHR